MPEEEKKLTSYSNPLLFEVEINHLCWACDLTERYRSTVIKSITLISVIGDNLTSLVVLESPELKKAIDFIKKHELVRKVDVVMTNEKMATLKVTSSYKAMTWKLMHESNVSMLESASTRDGVDSEVLLAPSDKEMRELLSKWKEQPGYEEVKLKKKRYLKPEEAGSLEIFRTSGFFDLKLAKDQMTEKQMEMFQLACDYGYYDNPKKVTLEELAERVGVAPSTLAEHLRKAESKMLPIFWKILRKI